MAQYHFAARLIQRSKGQSAVASAAYRAGQSLSDNRIGKQFDFTRHLGVAYTDIIAPANAPAWMLDREELWNAVEKAEKRKDAQLARSIDIALPHELTLDQNIELLRGFVQEQFVDRGMIADIAIHLPGRTGDIRNVHAHIALTTREITADGFGQKQRDWNDKKELVAWRRAWADHANRILEREGFDERIDPSCPQEEAPAQHHSQLHRHLRMPHQERCRPYPAPRLSHQGRPASFRSDRRGLAGAFSPVPATR